MKTLFFFWRDSPQWARVSSFMRFVDHTQRNTVGNTPLDEWSTRRRDLYLTTLTGDKHHDPGEIRSNNLSRRAAADLRLRPRGRWDRNEGVLERSKLSSCILPEWRSLWRDYAQIVLLDVTVMPVDSPYPSLRKAMPIIFFIVSRTTSFEG